MFLEDGEVLWVAFAELAQEAKWDLLVDGKLDELVDNPGEDG